MIAKKRNERARDIAKRNPVAVVCSALEDVDRLEEWKATGNDKAEDLAERLQGREINDRRYACRDPFLPIELVETPALPGRYRVHDSLFLVSGTWGKEGEGEPGIIGRKPIQERSQLPDKPPGQPPSQPIDFSISTPDPDPDPVVTHWITHPLGWESLCRAIWEHVRSFLPEEMTPEGSWPPQDAELAKHLFNESLRRSLRPVFDNLGRRWYPDARPLAWVIEALEKTPVAPGLSALAVVVGRMKDVPPSFVGATLLSREETRGSPESPSIILARFPGVVSLMEAPLQGLDQEGDLVATPSPESISSRPTVRRYQPIIPLQRTLFPGPLTLQGNTTQGTWIGLLSEIDLGDYRSPLRSDLCRLGLIAYALSTPAIITEDVGAILVGGRDTPANRRRFWAVHQVMRHLHMKVGRHGGRYDLFDAQAAGAVATLGPPLWWIEKAGPMHFKLSAAIARLPGLHGSIRNAGLYRTLNGLELALLYGPTAARKMGGRVSNCFRSVYSGGPGPEVFVKNWQLLRFAGENVTQESYRSRSLERHRYKKRVEEIRAAGYFCLDGKPAAAGDTIEILRQVKGGRNHPGGLTVRASARGCRLQKAGRNGGEDRRLPGSHLIHRLQID